jgi:hypothetical protein
MTHDIILNEESAGYIQSYLDFFASPSKLNVAGQQSPFNYERAREVVQNDPVVKAAMIGMVDKVCEGGWRLDERQKGAQLSVYESRLRKYRFNNTLRKAVYNLLFYNNVFVEIINQEGLLKYANVLEGQFMRIKSEPNGDIIGYYQEGIGPENELPSWTPEQITHIKLDDYTTNVWSEFNMEALYETILIKDAIRVWLHWFYKTNQLKPVISVSEDATEDEFLSFLAYIKSASTSHHDKPIPVKGKVEVKPLYEFQGKPILDVLEWCDRQILSLLQMPPIGVGIGNESGRADAAEYRPYLNTRVRAIHNVLEEAFTYDLFPKSGLSSCSFAFGVLDETVRRDIFETVEVMRRAQFSEGAIAEYLKSQGVVFDTDKIFVPPEVLAGMSNKELGTGNESIKGNESADAAGSRARQGSGEMQEANREAQ